ncbi:hypothetical protein [Paenibacillus sp. P36]|uniref:hypothetical protein n=1 Tax=Paenibacillus sp. P36 TaxID=3342538 RepID=UPI0038B284FF
MEKVNNSEELMEAIINMDSEHSVRQFHIPGKGKFTVVLQEEDHLSISSEVKSNSDLKRMIDESREEYKQGKGMSTTELLKSLSPR